MDSMKIKIGDFTLQNPITLASGTAGYGEEMMHFIDASKLGAIFTKGLSINPRAGNKGHRIMETPSGMLNSIGLENVGLDVFLKEKVPFLKKHNITFIPNVAGHSLEENVELCKVLSETEGVDALELNVSCPNVKEGGIAFGTNCDVFTELLDAVRPVTKCALIVKLSPNVTDVTEFAILAEKAGADGLSAVNTFLGMHIDIEKKKPHFNNIVAGLSGPAIMPMALRVVYQIYEKVSIPIVGMGGIASVKDMIRFIMAGAGAVSLGTMNMIHPTLGIDLLSQYTEYLNSENRTHDEIIGSVH